MLRLLIHSPLSSLILISGRTVPFLSQVALFASAFLLLTMLRSLRHLEEELLNCHMIDAVQITAFLLLNNYNARLSQARAGSHSLFQRTPNELSWDSFLPTYLILTRQDDQETFKFPSLVQTASKLIRLPALAPARSRLLLSLTSCKASHSAIRTQPSAAMEN